MDENFIRERITALRQAKNVSERKMSLDLGHSTSYIRGISSGRAYPSMQEFPFICEYLGVTPMEFFNVEQQTTALQQKAFGYIHGMCDKDVALLISFIERMNLGADK